MKKINFHQRKNIFEKSKISMKNEKNPSVEMRFFIEIFDFPKIYLSLMKKYFFIEKNILVKKTDT